MKIITIAHQKGGVGKSTLSLNICYGLKKLNYKVAIIDTDKQGTSYALGQKIDVYRRDEDVPDDYDFIIVDTPPYLTSEYVKLFTSSDLVIIPTRPSPADVVAIGGTIDLYQQARIQNNKVKAAIVYNAVDSRTTLVEDVSEEIEKFEIPVFNTRIENRVAYVRTLVDTEGIFSHPDEKKGHAEIMKLTNEILKAL